MKKYRLFNDDCLNVLPEIADGSVDCVICDLPYGTTSCGWDNVIPFDDLWREYNRVVKANGNIVLFCSGLFTYKLIESNIKNFKYKLIWKKNVPTGMSSAKYRPMKYYEEICLFNRGRGTYNPIMKERVGVGKACYNYDHYAGHSNHIELEKRPRKYDPDFVQPSDVLEFGVVPNRSGKLHPTQKPVDLLRWLVKTYSEEGDVVLDNCMGSGSTGVACLMENRRFVGIEISKTYFDIAENRIQQECENIQ